MLLRSFSLAAFTAVLVGAATLTATRRARESLFQNSQTTPACTTQWSTPKRLKLGAGDIHVDAPQMVALPTGVAFFGDNAIAAELTDSGFVPVIGWPRGRDMIGGVLIRPSGDVIPIDAPPGVRAFIGVHAASDGHVAHVFWAGAADTLPEQFLRMNSLWYARFDGTAWTQPELIVADTNLIWAKELTTIVMAKGRAHVIAIIRGTGTGLHALHIVRDAAGRGSITRLDIKPLYANLAIGPDGAIWLSTIEGDRLNRARVLVRRSTDGGETWSEPTEVYRSGSGTAYDPRLAVTGNGTAYVAWIVEPPGTTVGFAERIELAASVDRGVTWRLMPAITAPPDVRGLWLLADGPNELQVVFHTNDAEGQVVAMRLAAERWSKQSSFGPTRFTANLAAPKPDTLYLAWMEWLVAEPERFAKLMLSRRRSCLE